MGLDHHCARRIFLLLAVIGISLFVMKGRGTQLGAVKRTTITTTAVDTSG